jgi:hypothetical protein
MEPQLPELMKEIDFIHDSLMPDPKNYHTWAYLNWLYSSFSNLPEERGGDRFSSQSWKAELEWCERMLDSDHRFIRSPSKEGHDWLDEKVQLLSGEDEAKGEVIGRGDGRTRVSHPFRGFKRGLGLTKTSIRKIRLVGNSHNPTQRIGLELFARVSHVDRLPSSGV